MTNKVSKKNISSFFKKMQLEIITALEKSDGKAKFSAEKWKRKAGGGGITRVIQKGKVFEKGGVNFSAVSGKCPDFLIKEYATKSFIPQNFYATGLSIVIHPHSPHVPIIHMNVRYFELIQKNPAPSGSITLSGEKKIIWFGGGIDLTPHYVDKEDARFFHQSLKNICDKHDKKYYAEFKKWADDYFFINHRNETRGIGGIFFDHLTPGNSEMAKGKTIEEIFEFVKSVAKVFLPVYLSLVKKNISKPFNNKEKEWQLIRRGRYVEFNLVYDKGTKFGLISGGRTESILMSLPKEAKWMYNYKPGKKSPEEITLKLLRKGINWIEK